MKVVFVISTLVTGGAETMVSRLATEMYHNGIDVEIICTHNRKGTFLEKRLEESGIPIYYINKKAKHSVVAILQMFSLLSTIKPDVVHSHLEAAFYSLPWVLVHRVKQVHTIHTKPDREFTPFLSKVLYVMMRLNKLVMVAISKENYSMAKSTYGTKGRWLKCVNNPVETTRYYHNRDRQDNHIVFVNVSRQDSNKNQIMAIRAMKEVIKQIPEARLVLVGNGDQHETLIRERDFLGLQDVISLPGEQSNPEHYLANADIYISVSHMEGLPLSILEAMAAELPIISTDVGGVSDIVHDNGVLIPAGDKDALVEAMVLFAKNNDMVEEYGKRSLEIVKEYDVKPCAEAYLRIYRETL